MQAMVNKHTLGVQSFSECGCLQSNNVFFFARLSTDPVCLNCLTFFFVTAVCGHDWNAFLCLYFTRLPLCDPLLCVCALEFSTFVGGKITYWPSISSQYLNVVMYAVFTFMDVGGSAWCILNMPTRHLTRKCIVQHEPQTPSLANESPMDDNKRSRSGRSFLLLGVCRGNERTGWRGFSVWGIWRR